MKLLSACILRRNTDTPPVVILDAAYNLADHSLFTRNFVRDFLARASRVVFGRTEGALSVDYSDGFEMAMHCFVEADGLGVLVTADKSYPARVAIAMAKELMGDFRAAHGAAPAWRACVEDGGCRLPGLEAALRDWQAPARVDEVEKELLARLGETEGLPAREVLLPGDVPAAPACEIDSAEKFRNHYVTASMMHYTSGFVARCCSLA